MKKLYILIAFFIIAVNAYSQQDDFSYQKIGVKDVKKGVMKSTNEVKEKTSNNNRSRPFEDFANGETVGNLSVSLTGGAQYDVPMSVPSGVNGVMPNIALTYNSQNGDGIAGYGWNVSGLSSITRVPSTKLHDNQNVGILFKETDRFSFDGQRLMLKSGSYGGDGTVYETETFSNLKIVSFGISPYGESYGPKSFIVYYPDGSKAYYGNLSNSFNQTTYAITHWENPQGLRIDYFYQNVNTQWVSENTNSLKLQSIKYGGMSRDSHINEISFSYGFKQRRTHAYINGIPFKSNEILDKVSIFSNNQLYRTYNLAHELTNLNYPKLVSIQEVAVSDNLGQRKEPIKFEYLDTPDTVEYENLTLDLSIGNIEQRNADVLSLDLSGNGKMDFIVYPKTKDKFWVFDNLETNQTNNAWLANTGSFETIFSTIPLNYANKILGGNGIGIIQNGEDNQVHFKMYAKAPPSTGNPISLDYTKTWNAPQYSNTINNVAELNKTPMEYLSGDFNGDGLTDVLAVGKPYDKRECTTYDCEDWGGNTGVQDGNGELCYDCDLEEVENKTVFLIDLNRNIVSNFSSQIGEIAQKIDNEDQLRVIDFNGDGKSDLAHIKDSEIFIYSLNETNQLVQIGYRSLTPINPEKPLLFGDYNGDGLTDLMIPKSFSEPNSFLMLISTGSSNTSFVSSWVTTPFQYTQPEINGNLYKNNNLIPVDIDGDGRTDIVDFFTWTSNSDGLLSFSVYNNQSSLNHSMHKIKFILSDSASTYGDISTFPLPIFLSSNERNKGLELASISDNTVYKFTFNADHREDVLLRSITNNGVQQKIHYKNLDPDEYLDDNIQLYHESNNQTYPYIDLRVSPGSKLVSKLERVVENSPTLKKVFAYKGGIYNIEGLGLIGFEGFAQSNWHTGISDRIFNVSKYDPELRNALTEQYSIANYLSFITPNSNYITKTSNQYTVDLLPNKVFNLKLESSLTQNNLNGTFTNVTYDYDAFNSPTVISTNYSGAGTHQMTFNYENNTTSNNYYIGRIVEQQETSSVGTETFQAKNVFEYDGYLVKIKKSQGNNTPFNTEKYQYDGYGNLIEINAQPDGENSRTIKFEFDSSGRFPIKSYDVNNFVTTYDYNDFGELGKKVNYLGHVDRYEYDAFNRLIKHTDYLGNESTIDIAETDNIYTITQSTTDGSEQITIYDALKRVTKVSQKDVLGQWINSSYTYDKFDRAISTSEPYIGNTPSQWNATEYDFYGRPVSQTLHTGKVITMSYNELTTTVNDGVKTVVSTTNAMGKVLSVNDPGGTINYNYYGNGALKSTEFNGQITSIEQDGWGRKKKLIDPSAGEFTYSYDGYGQVINETTPKGNTDYLYSDTGELLKTTMVGDHTNMITTYNYTPEKLIDNIQMSSTNGNNASYNYTYDNLSRLESLSEQNSFAEFNKSYSYDAFGRVNTERYNAKLLSNGYESSKRVRYNYSFGDLESISDYGTNETIWEVEGLNARGQITQAKYGANIIENNVYDNFGYLNTNEVKNTINQQVLMTLGTDFNAERGTLNSRTNSMFSWSETFEYDDLDRLISFTNNEGTTNQAYDNVGRITSNDNVGDYNYNDASYQLASTDLNPIGNAYYQQNPLQQVGYNAFKKAHEINQEGQEKIGFQYNAFKGRSHMFYGGTEDNIFNRNNRKHYSYDGSMEISYDNTEEETTFITYIGGDAYSAPAVWRSKASFEGLNEEYYYLHRDYLGSILLITDEDGNAQEKRHFDAWGKIAQLTDGNGNAIDAFKILDRGYTGHEHLQGVGLIHMNGRLYDPQLHRFLSPDNYVQDMYNTQNYNRYGYVLNNPLMYTDPSGEIIEPGTLISIIYGLSFLIGANAILNNVIFPDNNSHSNSASNPSQSTPLSSTSQNNSKELSSSLSGNNIIPPKRNIWGNWGERFTGIENAAKGVKSLISTFFDSINNPDKAPMPLDWNGSLTRLISGDAISLGGSLSLNAILGIDIGGEFTWVYRGPDASFIPNFEFGPAASLSNGGHATVNGWVSMKWYAGEVADIKAVDLGGYSVFSDIGITEGIGGSFGGDVGFNYNKGKFKPTWISATLTGSLGARASPMFPASWEGGVRHNTILIHNEGRDITIFDPFENDAWFHHSFENKK